MRSDDPTGKGPFLPSQGGTKSGSCAFDAERRAPGGRILPTRKLLTSINLRAAACMDALLLTDRVGMFRMVPD